ncbi:MAG: hypothetical protein JST03_07640 [Bacteroidetes bacterium]|nr:hypothetical protein [Bacteroidota bacterium]
MKSYFSNWNLMRLLRLAAGIFILIQGLQVHEWIFIIAGLWFTLMPLLNIGCCGSASCNTPMKQWKNKNDRENFENIKNKTC